MPKKRKKKKVEEKIVEENVKDLNQKITEIATELIYMSETDADILAFSGKKTDVVNKETLLNQLKKDLNLRVEEKSFDDFFEPLIEIQDWFGEDERKMSENFGKLKDLLQQNLISKKVFKIGKKDIDIYVLGLDAEDILRGIQTKAVET